MELDINMMNPFISSLVNSLAMFCQDKPKKKNVRLLNEMDRNTNTHVMIGLTGNLYGTVFLSTDKENGLKVASKMAGMPLTEWDDISRSALQELMNMTSGGALSELANIGISADITPPTFMSGTDLFMQVPFPLINMEFNLGDAVFYVNLSIKKKLAKTIVLADDARFMRETITVILEKEGYMVLAKCVDGEEVLNKLIAGLPDVLLLDITMPKKNGLEVLKEVKGKYTMLKVIMVSAVGNPEIIQEAMRLGADGYVKKPFQPNELINAIKKL